MSTVSTDGGAPVPGYLSEASKRRYTVVAGLLGAGFFVAQMVLPIVVVLALWLPMMTGQAMKTADLDHAVLMGGEIWYVERTTRLEWGDLEGSKTMRAVARARLDDLAPVAAPLPLDGEPSSSESDPALLPVGEKLWVIGAEGVSRVDGSVVTRFDGAKRPRRASDPFVHDGRPAVFVLGAQPLLSTLLVDGSRAQWRSEPVDLGLPPEAGSLRALRGVEARGGLYVLAELCSEEPASCSLRYRAPGESEWRTLSEDDCACSDWTPVVLGGKPVVVRPRREDGRTARVEIVTLEAAGPVSQSVDLERRSLGFGRWRPLAAERRLILVSQGMPGSLRLTELADGRIVRSAKRAGSFPFSSGLFGMMLVPQVLPVALSLALALLLSAQMRRHRIQEYVSAAERRRFASLWQRALAQLVDAVPLGAGFLLPALWMHRTLGDPESMVEQGPLFPLWIVGSFAAAFVWSLGVLAVYSFFEGRSGKTPGKWLLRIRVLGTDLQPCGFGRALLRNLLTFVDGFFNFLVGVLLVALTESWQRLGDLAARTIVVRDEKAR